MPCQHNHIDCPCTKDCPRHGHCCACAKHHKDCAIGKEPGTAKLPACLRGIEWAK